MPFTVQGIIHINLNKLKNSPIAMLCAEQLPTRHAFGQIFL